VGAGFKMHVAKSALATACYHNALTGFRQVTSQNWFVFFLDKLKERAGGYFDVKVVACRTVHLAFSTVAATFGFEVLFEFKR
jgi:hypothetical protein